MIKDEDNIEAGWESNSGKDKLSTKCGYETFLGGPGIGAPGKKLTRNLDLPEHKRVTLDLEGIIINSSGNESIKIKANGK